MVRYLDCGASLYIYALCLVFKSNLQIIRDNMALLFATHILLAHKMLRDDPYSMDHYRKVFGIRLSDLRTMEMSLLCHFDWNTSVSGLEFDTFLNDFAWSHYRHRFPGGVFTIRLPHPSFEEEEKSGPVAAETVQDSLSPNVSSSVTSDSPISSSVDSSIESSSVQSSSVQSSSTVTSSSLNQGITKPSYKSALLSFKKPSRPRLSPVRITATMTHSFQTCSKKNSTLQPIHLPQKTISGTLLSDRRNLDSVGDVPLGVMDLQHSLDSWSKKRTLSPDGKTS